MRKQFIMSCVMALMWGGGSLSAMAGPVSVVLRVTVSAPTCDMALVSPSSLYFLPFTPDDFQHHTLAGKDSQPVILSLVGRGCQRTPVALNRRLQLLVSGPVGLGGRGEVWGDMNDDLAWGVRLRYRSPGLLRYRHIAPNNNRIEVSRPPPGHHLRHAGEDLLVMQPEIYAWERSRVKSGGGLMIPLVFSMMYE